MEKIKRKVKVEFDTELWHIKDILLLWQLDETIKAKTSYDAAVRWCEDNNCEIVSTIMED